MAFHVLILALNEKASISKPEKECKTWRFAPIKTQ